MKVAKIICGALSLLSVISALFAGVVSNYSDGNGAKITMFVLLFIGTIFAAVADVCEGK